MPTGIMFVKQLEARGGKNCVFSAYTGVFHFHNSVYEVCYLCENQKFIVYCIWSIDLDLGCRIVGCGDPVPLAFGSITSNPDEEKRAEMD